MFEKPTGDQRVVARSEGAGRRRRLTVKQMALREGFVVPHVEAEDFQLSLRNERPARDKALAARCEDKARCEESKVQAWPTGNFLAEPHLVDPPQQMQELSLG